MSTHTAGPMEAARAAWVRIGRAKPNGDIDIFRKADAEMRLIAAAPDLLAALQALTQEADFIDLNVLSKVHGGPRLLRVVLAARAAISKARE